jgi:hypothetical protein
MGNRSWLQPLTGVLFVVLVIIGFGLGGEPPDPTEDSAQEIIDFYVDNKDEVFAGSVLQAIAGALLIFFGAYAFKRLRASGADASAAVAFAGTIAFAVGIAIDGTINVALAETADDLDPGGVQTLSALWNNDFLPFAMGLSVFLWGMGVAIVRHGALPKWLGWAAIVAALTAISPAFFVGGIAAALLILVSSVIWSREERSSSPTARAPAA